MNQEKLDIMKNKILTDVFLSSVYFMLSPLLLLYNIKIFIKSKS